MGSPVSSLNPYQFAFNGYVFGAGSNGVVVENVDGLASLSPLRIQDDNRGYIDGSYSGRDFLEGRTVTFDVLVLGDNVHSAQYYYKQLQSNLTFQQMGLYPNPATPAANQLGVFQFFLTSDSFSGDSTVTGLRRMYGRVRAITTPITPEYSYGYIAAQIEFYFPDPRYYDDTAKTSSGSIVNNGWATTCPLITIASPASTFTISDGTNNMLFGSVDISKNLVIDLLGRIITQNNQPARNTFVSGYTWLSVAGNTTSTFTINSGTMSITYRNAYV